MFPFDDVIMKGAYFFQDGGELYFSDMYICSPVPEGIKGDKELWSKLTHWPLEIWIRLKKSIFNLVSQNFLC